MPVFYIIKPRGVVSSPSRLGARGIPIRTRVDLRSALPINVSFSREDFQCLRDAFVQALIDNRVGMHLDASNTSIILKISRRQVNLIPYFVTYLKKLESVFYRAVRVDHSSLQSHIRAIEAQVTRDMRRSF